ncbi:MAG: hypothetical protein ACO28M_11915 [Vulcanococcus sp.]
MSTFPSLKPSARTWSLGAQPVSTFTTMSGHETRVLLGPEPIGTMLSLQFVNLKEAVVLQITGHYQGQRGSFDAFALPAEVFAGMTNYASVTPAGQVWRYAASPQIEWHSPGVATVSVELTAVIE